MESAIFCDANLFHQTMGMFGTSSGSKPAVEHTASVSPPGGNGQQEESVKSPFLMARNWSKDMDGAGTDPNGEEVLIPHQGTAPPDCGTEQPVDYACMRSSAHTHRPAGSLPTHVSANRVAAMRWWRGLTCGVRPLNSFSWEARILRALQSHCKREMTLFSAL